MALQLMAEALCSRRVRSVAAAADFVLENASFGLSKRQLQRLYARYGEALEVAYMRKLADRRIGEFRDTGPEDWQAMLDRVQRLIREDERVVVVARDLERRMPGGRVPIHRWYPAELRELLHRVELLCGR